MTLPTDFASFASGWNFNSANYSTPGSGGGTYANLVSGQQPLTRGATSPVHSSKGTGGTNLEGMEFTGAVGGICTLDDIYGQERTLLLIGALSGTDAYFFGSTETGTARYSAGIAGSKAATYFSNWGYSAASSNNRTVDVPFVATFGWCPQNMLGYAQLNDTTPAGQTSLATMNGAFCSHWDSCFGRTRTVYADSGVWIARALIFNRCLFYSDNAALQSLIDTEMASIGL